MVVVVVMVVVIIIFLSDHCNGVDLSADDKGSSTTIYPRCILIFSSNIFHLKACVVISNAL